MTHYHFMIMAYNDIDKTNNSWIEGVKFTSRASSESHAVKQATKVVTRKNYKLLEVWECYQNHAQIDKMVKALSEAHE